MGIIEANPKKSYKKLDEVKLMSEAQKSFLLSNLSVDQRI